MMTRYFKIFSGVGFFIVLLLLTSLTAAAGTWSHETIGGLDTHLYVPSTTPTTMLDGKRALMVSLHGCVQTNSDMQSGANWQTTADNYGMVVALPQASGSGFYGQFYGCWDFYGMNHTRTNRDNGYLLALVDELLNRPELNIDPNQVYITGLSSGGGMTNVMFCLAPDIFAGVGVNAGPAPGSNGLDLTNPSISVAQGASNCNQLAQVGGDHRPAFATQVWNTVHGTTDPTVDVAHAHRNADIAAAVYGNVTQDNFTTPIPGDGIETVWRDAQGPRVSKLIVTGMGHAWPAGIGSSGSSNYIDHAHVNYPEYITAFFFDNNRRVSQVADTTPPTVDVTNPADGATVSGVVTITAVASDDVGVSQVDFYLNDVLVGTDSSAPYEYSWNTLGSAPPVAIKAVAADAAGNTATDDDTAVTVTTPTDSTPPTVNVTSPTNGASVNGAIMITVDAADAETGINQVDFYLDNNLVGTDTTLPYEYSWDTTSYSGSVAIKAVAFDGANNSATDNDTTVSVNSFVCQDWYASNYAHTTAGRAYVSFGITYANGSNDNMGLWNVFVHNWLREVAPDYYEIGQCP